MQDTHLVRALALMLTLARLRAWAATEPGLAAALAILALLASSSVRRRRRQPVGENKKRLYTRGQSIRLAITLKEYAMNNYPDVLTAAVLLAAYAPSSAAWQRRLLLVVLLLCYAPPV